jgi:hypothetical protein
MKFRDERIYLAPFERKISCLGVQNRSLLRMGRSNIPKADGQFSNAPIFNFNDGKLKFNTNDVSNANENYGSASGAVPKSLLIAMPRSKSGHCIFY